MSVKGMGRQSWSNFQDEFGRQGTKTKLLQDLGMRRSASSGRLVAASKVAVSAALPRTSSNPSLDMGLRISRSASSSSSLRSSRRKGANYKYSSQQRALSGKSLSKQKQEGQGSNNMNRSLSSLGSSLSSLGGSFSEGLSLR